jgi:hypothetical protein
MNTSTPSSAVILLPALVFAQALTDENSPPQAQSGPAPSTQGAGASNPMKIGDIIFTGTPSGVGFARKPPVWMKNGDVCEVEIQGLGVLRNPIADEKAS